MSGTIAVAGVTVESLRSIGKGAKAKKTAEKLMKKFIEDTVPAISTSGIWTEDPSLLPPGTVPKTLIAYFADGDGLDAQGQQITFGVNVCFFSSFRSCASHVTSFSSQLQGKWLIMPSKHAFQMLHPL